MDKIWYEKRIKEYESVKPEIERLLKEEFKIPEKDFEIIMNDLNSQYHNNASTLLRMTVIIKCVKDGSYEEEYEHRIDLIKSSGIEELFNKYTKKNSLHEYLDSEPMGFDGDILITDPCYVIREDKDSDWDTCCCGFDMEKLGINHYMTRDTLYGDWSCTVYDSDTKQPIGHFCADAGLVSVFLLDEVLKYNPDYDCDLKESYTAMIIRDFKGTVQFVVKHIDGYYEDTTKYHEKGDYWEDYLLEVVGHGINKATGKPINFVSKQTGL